MLSDFSGWLCMQLYGIYSGIYVILYSCTGLYNVYIVTAGSLIGIWERPCVVVWSLKSKTNLKTYMHNSCIAIYLYG